MVKKNDYYDNFIFFVTWDLFGKRDFLGGLECGSYLFDGNLRELLMFSFNMTSEIIFSNMNWTKRARWQ